MSRNAHILGMICVREHVFMWLHGLLLSEFCYPIYENTLQKTPNYQEPWMAQAVLRKKNKAEGGAPGWLWLSWLSVYL